MNQIVDHSGAEADAAREPGVPAGVPVDYYASYMGLQGEMEQVLRESARQAEEIVRLRGLLEAGHGRARTNTDGHGRKWAGELPALPEIPTPTDLIQWAIIKAGLDLINLLLEKNRMYGASVFFPMHTFARASWREAIYVRLDDKLARLRSGQADDKEDPSTDIAGYLVLEKSGRLLEDHGVILAEATPAHSAPTLDKPEASQDALLKSSQKSYALTLERDVALFDAKCLKAERDEWCQRWKQLHEEVERKETRIQVLEVANDSLTQYSRNLTAQRDALQARIDAQAAEPSTPAHSA